MFYGESSHALDGKFRVTIPKRFQEQLGRELAPDSSGTLACFLTRGQDRCLYLFTEKGFERALAGLSIAAFNGENQRAAQRVFFANTARVELDAQGRVLVPEKLRAHLGTDKDVVIVGVADHAEIWAQATWESYHAQHEPILDSVDQVLGSRGVDRGN
ncbi:MAG: division/cell wall cluster transcriptional repressor MraZ [Planctomycetota bacterium]|nr:division/cell wall cluster transcriptional repressor MraZ [Planctomycetota bacterium]